MINNCFSYDPVAFDNGMKSTGSVWSDRMLQWDYNKHNELCQKHFGDKGQIWEGRSPDQIELFLRDYLEKPNLILCRVIEEVNSANGHPVWCFTYTEGKS